MITKRYFVEMKLPNEKEWCVIYPIPNGLEGAKKMKSEYEEADIIGAKDKLPDFKTPCEYRIKEITTTERII